MNKETQNISVRWVYMCTGVVAMVFAGILYAWSILKSPLTAECGTIAIMVSVIAFFFGYLDS